MPIEDKYENVQAFILLVIFSIRGLQSAATDALIGVFGTTFQLTIFNF